MNTKRLIKLLKRILLYTFIAVVTFVSIIVGSTYLYRDELIDYFVKEANKSLNTPVHVGAIEVNAFDKFPMIALTFNQVRIEESFPNSQENLLKADRVHFTFNPISLIRGDYSIRQVHLENADLSLKIDRQGRPNYAILKESGTGKKSPSKIQLRLNRIHLINTHFTYQNEALAQNVDVHTPSLRASLQNQGTYFDIAAEGQLKSNVLNFDSISYLKGKNWLIDAKFSYDGAKGNISFSPSSLKLSGSKASFLVYGGYRFGKINTVDLFMEGESANIQTLLQLLPEKWVQPLSAYKSKGEVFFDLELGGAISKNQSPGLKVDFGFKGATVFHPGTKAQIQKANLIGSFETSSLRDLHKASLSLKEMEGILEGTPFRADFEMKNLEDPIVKLDFKGELEVVSLLKFHPIEAIRSATGKVEIDIELEGRLNDFKNKSTAQRVNTSGEIGMQKIGIDMGNEDLMLNDLSGSLIFNKSDLAISDVSGRLGRSDFLLNGFLVNIVTYFLFEGQPLSIAADLKSEFIDLDALLSERFQEDIPESTSAAPVTDTVAYSLSIPENLVLSFDCNVEQLHFRRFHPEHIQGKLKVKEQLAALQKISFNALGGNIKLNSLVNTRNPDRMTAKSDLTLYRIDIDSIFYVFENFNQDFLVDRHLKGQIYAGIMSEMAFDKNLNLDNKSLTADISTSIKNGELNNFEPMQMLSKYVRQENLDHLRFSDLANDIHIENETIYLPEMEIRSNVSNILISGTHTLDQHIAYTVVAPIRNKERIDKDEAFGAIEEDASGRSKVYLKILGTTSDYTILYDTKSVKKKIIKDLKKEVKELKDAFKSKGKTEKKDKELEEDDYFDWDEDEEDGDGSVNN